MQTADQFKSKDRTHLEQNPTVPPQEVLTTEPSFLPHPMSLLHPFDLTPHTIRSPRTRLSPRGMTVSLTLAQESQSESDRIRILTVLLLL